MSLRRIAERLNQEGDDQFDQMMEDMGLDAPGPEEEAPDPAASPDRSAATRPLAPPASDPFGPGAPPAAPRASEAPVPEARLSESPPAPPPPSTLHGPAPEAPAAPRRPSRLDPAAPPAAVLPPIAVAPPGLPDEALTDRSSEPDPDDPAPLPAPLPAPPAGLDPGVQALLMSPDERVARFGSLKIEGSVVDAGPAEDMLAGKHPRPSVASQREIDRMNRQRLGGLLIRKPANWPDFMTYPTDLELRKLRNEGITEEGIRVFEEIKQREADAMEARAREINDWIFAYGTMKLNEQAQRSRARNRDAAIRKRSAGPDGKPIPDQHVSVEVTDEEVYPDRFYGIKFASLLNPHPDHLSKMRSEPVAAWGHDQLRTMDGGRIQARGDELIVRSSSLQAAKMLVLEAQARGWETLRVSGNHEFCAAVKRAAKEAGMGAIIHRRGPLGIGPFSAPEVIMPALPGSVMPRIVGSTEADQKARQEAAPQEDREAADLLLRDRPAGLRSAPGAPRPDRVRVEDPMRQPGAAVPSGPEPA